MMNYRADTARSALMAKNVYDKAPISRIELLDAWKGLAIIGVVVFHFAWDLEAFGLAPAGMTLRSEWIYFARSLARKSITTWHFFDFFEHARANLCTCVFLAPKTIF